MVLEFYGAMAGLRASQAVAPDRVEQAREWLTRKLSQLWKIDEVFKGLSKDAALIHGAIKNWSPDKRQSYARLTQLLGDFLPRQDFHSTFDPALDQAFLRLIAGELGAVSINATIDEWSAKIAELGALLEEIHKTDPMIANKE